MDYIIQQIKVDETKFFKSISTEDFDLKEKVFEKIFTFKTEASKILENIKKAMVSDDFIEAYDLEKAFKNIDRTMNNMTIADIKDEVVTIPRGLKNDLIVTSKILSNSFKTIENSIEEFEHNLTPLLSNYSIDDSMVKSNRKISNITNKSFTNLRNLENHFRDLIEVNEKDTSRAEDLLPNLKSLKLVVETITEKKFINLVEECIEDLEDLLKTTNKISNIILEKYDDYSDRSFDGIRDIIYLAANIIANSASIIQITRSTALTCTQICKVIEKI